MATFKLKDDRKESGFVPGVGRYTDGVLENAPDNFENPNFELAKEVEAEAPKATPTPVPTVPAQPAVAPVQPVNQTPVQEGAK